MILIALGANIPGPAGPPVKTLKAALSILPQYGVEIERLSSLYQTAAVTLPGTPAQPDYVNAVARIETAHDPSELMAVLHQVEAQLGRSRRDRWEPRPLDLDLLDYRGQVKSPESGDTLQLPHPGIAGRAFVLVPLLEVASEWRHPETRLSCRELLRQLEGRADLAPVTEGILSYKPAAE